MVPNCVPTNDEKKNDIPFEGPYSKSSSTVTDKSGAKHTPMSRVRHLARQAMEKQKGKMGSMKKTVKESRKTEIVKDVVKNKKEEMKKAETFVSEPVLSSNITKT
jgi:diphthamide synthase subunit DPH2